LVALDIENKKADNTAANNELDAETADQDRAADLEKARIASETDIAVALIRAGGTIDAEAMKQKFASEPVELGNEAIQLTGQAVDDLNQSLQSSVGSINQAIERIQNLQTAKRNIVRDEEGNIIGVEVNGELREVERDGEGNVTGL